MHGEGCHLAYQWHGLHRAVTGEATNAVGDVDRVIEIDVYGQAMHAVPVQRLVFGQARPHRRQHLGVGK